MKFVIAIIVLVAQALVGAARADVPFTVSWGAPSGCTDGTTTCLAHIVSTRIHWQEGPTHLVGQLVGNATVPLPALNYTVNLPAANMCFKAFFVMDDGVKSAPSNVVCLDKSPLPDTDTDADGVPDSVDNCVWKANTMQVDSDTDGFGNVCDADLNNDGRTDEFDMALFRLQLGQSSVAPVYNSADFNADGFVNAFDTVVIRRLMGTIPGGP